MCGPPNKLLVPLPAGARQRNPADRQHITELSQETKLRVMTRVSAKTMIGRLWNLSPIIHGKN